jgi:beta-glucuronidase
MTSPALPPSVLFAPAPLPRPSEHRSRADLRGVWDRYVNGERFDAILVPSSQPPLGCYRLKRDCMLPGVEGQRAFLHFEAITYYGRAFWNGVELGAMGPYVPHEFEITRALRSGKNHAEIEIADLAPAKGGAGKDEIAIGVNPGWEAYGGIIRDAYVEYCPQSFIDNVRLAYRLNAPYKEVDCIVRVYLSSGAEAEGQLEVTLREGANPVARGEKQVRLQSGMNEAEIPFRVDAPSLWSPRNPSLYSLAVTLRTASGTDSFECRTGFRDLKIKGRQFELNGEPLVLAGVCRHDMWKDQGFTLTRGQMERDMRMIKTMGANFVRLAHYPHHRYIVELADELGLFVTEEPGYWQVEFPSMARSEIEAGLGILEGAIRRDWNSPAVFAWLLGNESRLTLDYLREGKALCNRLDPLARPVSFANDTAKEKAKPIFEQAGLDFFSQHLYDFSEKKFEQTADFYGDGKPLIIDEWGWEDAGRGQITYERSFDRLMDVVEAGKIAGHSFWSWQDIRQYTRIDWPTQNGILLSGVVDEAREPRGKLYVELSRLFQMRRHEEPPQATRPERVPLRSVTWAPGAVFEPVELQALAEAPESRRAWESLEALMAKYWAASWIHEDQWKRTGGKLLFWQGSDVDIGSARFRCPVIEGHVRPLVVTADFPEITIPVAKNCAHLHILGNVTLPDGYPVNGKFGEPAASFDVAGRQVPVRNGIETARANMVHQATRINPIATAAPPALRFMKDIVREHYQVLLFTLAAGGRVESLRVRLAPGAQPLAIFGVTAERI